MKTKILPLCLLLMFCFELQSQSTRDYLSRPGLTIGSEHYNWAMGTTNNTYKFVGDTVLCGENLLIYQHTWHSFSRKLLRVEGSKVWEKNAVNPCEDEKLLFDFDLEIGDTTQSSYYQGYFVVDTDTITLHNGEERRRLYLAFDEYISPAVEWVDGIGSLSTGLFAKSDFEGHSMLTCVKENSGETIWLSPDSTPEACDSISCFMPEAGFNFAVDDFKVHFENHSFNHTSLQWDFGDGNTSTAFHPSHRYETPGCYEVTLTLSSNCLSQTIRERRLVSICQPQDWEVHSPGLTSSFLMVDFVSETVGWAIDNNQIWKTEDGGESWTEQFYPIPPEPTRRNLRTIDMVDEMNGVIALHNYSAPSSIEALLVTNDGGETWEEKKPGSYLLNSAIMTEDGQVFGTGQFDGIFYSDDWGNSFVEIPPTEVDFSRFQYLGNNELIASGIKGLVPTYATRAISYSDDSGQSWKHHFLPEEYFGVSDIHFFNADEGFACGFNGFILKTEDGGETWREIHYDDRRSVYTIHFVDEMTGWATGYEGLVLSTSDGGETWESGNCGYPYRLGSISALDAETCWIGSPNGKYLKFNPEAEADCAPVHTQDHEPDHIQLHFYPNPTSNTVTIAPEIPESNSTNNQVFVYNSLGQSIYESCPFDKSE